MAIHKLSQRTTASKSSAAGTGSSAPIISSIIVCDSSYNNLDDTALDPAGSYVKLIGKGFKAGCTAYFNGSAITTTFVSPTEVRVVIPTITVGAYNIMLFNANNLGGGIYLNLGVSNFPTFTTSAGSLGSYYEANTISNTIVATGDTPLSYSLSSGTLPTGATLNSDGTLTGTAPTESGSTTYSFVVNVKDAQGQDATRSFNLTINTDVVTWNSPAEGNTITHMGSTSITPVILNGSAASGRAITYSANTLPGGLSLVSANGYIYGTPTATATTNTRFTATSSTTNRSATRDIIWSITLADPPGQTEYTTPGTYSFIVPNGHYSIVGLCVGGGGGGKDNSGGGGGGGGGLRYHNAISVTPGETLSITVGGGGLYYSPANGNGNQSKISRGATVLLYADGGASGYNSNFAAGGGGSSIGGSIGGGNGGSGGAWGATSQHGGGGGAGGYSGNGGNAGDRYFGNPSTAGSGGAGGGGGYASNGSTAGNGGGVGILGQGANGTAGTNGSTGGAGGAGSGGSGQLYGGGGHDKSAGAGGAVRILWGSSRSYPSNAGNV